MCEDKVTLLESIINTGMDMLLPLKYKTVNASEPPWINKQLKYLIRKRQKALEQGDRVLFLQLRNLVKSTTSIRLSIGKIASLLCGGKK